jgi:hypothetical protein
MFDPLAQAQWKRCQGAPAQHASLTVTCLGANRLCP